MGAHLKRCRIHFFKLTELLASRLLSVYFFTHAVHYPSKSSETASSRFNKLKMHSLFVFLTNNDIKKIRKR